MSKISELKLKCMKVLSKCYRCTCGVLGRGISVEEWSEFMPSILQVVDVFLERISVPVGTLSGSI